MDELYSTDVDFKTYVDKYCETRKVSLEEALTHATVREVGKYYNEISKERIIENDAKNN